MKWLVITTYPEHQSIFGSIKEHHLVGEMEAADREELISKLTIPIGCTVRAVEADLIVTVKSKVVNELVEEPE